MDKTIDQAYDDSRHQCDHFKPKLKLIGENGNAFAIMGRAMRAGREAGWSQEKLTAVMDNAKSGNYDHLLAVMAENFRVEGLPEDDNSLTEDSEDEEDE
jgi:hypothetical protein